MILNKKFFIKTLKTFLFLISITSMSNIEAIPKKHHPKKESKQCVYSSINNSLTGVASTYDNSLHSKKMANGKPYNKNILSAAHRTLPFNTLVKVYNPKNKKSVIVKILDRGPYAKKRIIDLSEAASKELGIITGKVILTIL